MSSKPELTDEEVRTLEGLLEKLSGQGAFLPPPLFHFVTQVTALPNVDLIVQDVDKGVLLAWRDDALGAGWHVPGSIIRHGEKFQDRILGCAEDEFGCDLCVAHKPFAIIQLFSAQYHNVALCFRATLAGTPRTRIIREAQVPEGGDLRWFTAFPDNIYPTHAIYREILEALDRGDLKEDIRIYTQNSDRALKGGAINSAPIT